MCERLCNETVFGVIITLSGSEKAKQFIVFIGIGVYLCVSA